MLPYDILRHIICRIFVERDHVGEEDTELPRDFMAGFPRMPIIVIERIEPTNTLALLLILQKLTATNWTIVRPPNATCELKCRLTLKLCHREIYVSDSPVSGLLDS